MTIEMRIIRRLFLLTIFVFSLLGACDPDGNPDDELVPTLSSLQSEVFTPRCDFASCHGGTTRAGGLALSEGMTHAELVDVGASNQAASDAGLIRVIPGDAANSFLMQKLSASLPPEYGEVMPPGSGGIEEDVLLAVEEWIARGAPDN